MLKTVRRGILDQRAPVLCVLRSMTLLVPQSTKTSVPRLEYTTIVLTRVDCVEIAHQLLRLLNHQVARRRRRRRLRAVAAQHLPPAVLLCHRHPALARRHRQVQAAQALLAHRQARHRHLAPVHQRQLLVQLQ